MLEKIETIKARIIELESMLADPALVSDFSKSQGLLKEHALIKPLAELSDEFTTIIEHIGQLKSIIKNDTDKDLVELANLELPELESKKLQLEKIKVPIALTKLIKTKIGDTLRFTIYHNERHIIQSEKAYNQIFKK